jgi:hypothetical protein
MIKALLAATALTLCAASPAAAGIPYGYDEFTDPVMPLPAAASDIAGDEVYLCHLVRKFHLAYVPVLYWSEGYVLGEQACTTERYHSLTADQISSLKATGVLPADLPALPSLTWAQRSPMIIEVLLIAAIAFSIHAAAKRQKARFAEMGSLPEISKRVLDTLCHAAHAAGLTTDNGHEFVARLTEKVTGNPISVALVSKIMATTAKPKQTDYARFAKGLTAPQRDTLMQAVLMVIAAGTGTKTGQSFVTNLATACKMDKKRLSGIVAKVAPV